MPRALLTDAHAALAASRYPKLLFVGDPGALVSPAFAAQCAASQHDCGLVPLGSGKHYLQEDHPDEIGASVARGSGRSSSAIASPTPERSGRAAWTGRSPALYTTQPRRSLGISFT